MGETDRLKVAGKWFEIRADEEAINTIMEAMSDENLSEQEKIDVALLIFFPKYDEIPNKQRYEAYEKCLQYLIEKIGYIEKTVVYRFPANFVFPRFCGEKNIKSKYSRKSACDSCPLLESDERFFCHLTKEYDDMDEYRMRIYGWDTKMIENHKVRRSVCPFFSGENIIYYKEQK